MASSIQLTIGDFRQELAKSLILLLVAITGFVNCVLSVGLAYRNKVFYENYRELGEALEKYYSPKGLASETGAGTQEINVSSNQAEMGKGLELKGVFKTGRNTSNELNTTILRWTRTDTLVIALPIVFAFLFVVFIVISFLLLAWNLRSLQATAA